MVVAGMVLTAALVVRVAVARRVRIVMTESQRRVVWGGVAAMFLANWVYVILFVG